MTKDIPIPTLLMRQIIKVGFMMKANENPKSMKQPSNTRKNNEAYLVFWCLKHKDS